MAGMQMRYMGYIHIYHIYINIYEYIYIYTFFLKSPAKTSVFGMPPGPAGGTLSH